MRLLSLLAALIFAFSITSHTANFGEDEPPVKRFRGNTEEVEIYNQPTSQGGLFLPDFTKMSSDFVPSFCPETPKKQRSNVAVKSIDKILERAYSQIEKIGAGDQSAIYRATRKRDEKEVALRVSSNCYNSKNEKIKNTFNIVNSTFKGQNTLLQYHRYEYKKLQRISLVETDLFQYDLAKYVKEINTEPLSELQLWHWLHDLSSGLEFLQKNNLVHLDIKPDNIFLNDDLSLVIGDYGLMRDTTIEQTDYDEGDSRYLAIEAIASAPLSHKMDIASLGFTMLELSTKMILPTEDLPWEELRLAKYEDRVRAKLNPIYSDELNQLIMQMINENPDLRPDAIDIKEKASRMIEILAE